MSELDNAVLVRKLYASAFDPDRLDEFLDPDCVYQGPDGTRRGLDELREVSRDLHRAFPDLRFMIDALRADGDEVEVQWRLRGTHDGPLEGFEPTGRPVEMQGHHVEVVRDGKIVERRGDSDLPSLVEQLRAAEEEDGDPDE